MTSLPSAIGVFNAPGELYIKDVYSLVLEAETAADDTLELIYARILGYLILYPINGIARAHVLSEIMSCNEDHRRFERNVALYELGKYYMDSFIRPLFRWRAGMCGDPNLPELLPPAEEMERLRCSMREGRYPKLEPVDYGTARIHALIRDNFHCILTGLLDMRSATRGYLEMLGLSRGKCTRVLCFFICGWGEPKYFNRFKPGEQENHLEFWNILASFGFPELRSELEGRNVYRLDNVMSVGVDMLYIMYNLRLWFEAIKGRDNCYTVHCVDERDYQDFGLPREICFTAEASALPLPNPKYLQIHAACAKVAYLSGAGCYLFQGGYHDNQSDTDSDVYYSE